MQFSVEKSALYQALSLVLRVVEKRSTIPVFCNAKLYADAGTLTITGTDLEVALTVRTEAKVDVSGVITLPANRLLECLRFAWELARMGVRSCGVGVFGMLFL
jgi:DNA polymerase-3 subunit beta